MYQLHQNSLLPLFRHRARVGIPEPDIFGIVCFRLCQPRFSGGKILEAIPHPVLAPLVLRIQGFQIAQITCQLHLHKDKGIAGSRCLHFRRIGGLGRHIIYDTLE